MSRNDAELPEVPRKSPDERPGILDRPATVKRWMQVLFAVSVALLFVDLVYHPHFHTELESGGGMKGFYGLYGFAGLVVLVLGAKLLRQLVMRREDYYGPQDSDAEPVPEPSEEAGHD